MKILITGGCGFIGSNLIYYLLNSHPDWHIINLDNLSYAAQGKNLAPLEKNPRYRLIVGAIEDQKTVLAALNGCDAIIHLAAQTHVDRSIVNPLPFVHTNTLGTQVLLDAARQASIPRFVHISTDEVYGALPEHAPPFTEQHPLAPRSPYAASKAAADLLILASYETFNMPVIIIRPSNNYGPYQFPEKFIPLAITNLLEGKKVPVYGTGQNIRDWIFVEDTCRAIETVLLKGTTGEVYNAGGACEKRNIELIQAILNLLGKDNEWIDFVPDRPAHDFRYALDNSKINQLGWRPTVDFTTGIERTVRWYQEHPEWWQPLKRHLQRGVQGFWT
ncbi:MAG: dTDP-glucose 4,6-dehydratase [candidate division WOR-3 bacterium]|jgi:dTDP-glucose 4,6-dehydratase|nr:dTDP-glucose 4,6-dehydratase [candidate division WOR-3 bacterium]MCR4424109.1 dTDP-glucose 4,6-dehydratase [candidate division WOR-3 bacterium]MDH7519472.1 dTDP-glucose 4,6-dehydratase [bacterium]